MRHYYVYCQNCGDKYSYYASGHYFPEYNHADYCATCRKAMLEAFAKIPQKSECTWIETDEIDLNTILKWEKEVSDEYETMIKEKEAKGEFCFPRMRRVACSLARYEDMKFIEMQISGYVYGKDSKEGRYYCYAYWPSEKEQNKARITVSVRLSIPDREILEYLKI